MQASAKRRYYQKAAPRRPSPTSVAPHSEFLRTGKIERGPTWDRDTKRYITFEDVAESTNRKLVRAGETTHERINGFHKAIRFPKVIFSRVFEDIPHLGYCHVTTSSTRFKQRGPVHWSFYIANFSSDISESYPFFENIRISSARMYFAVAYEKAAGDTLRIDRSLRKDGLLFRTDDPREAMKNHLLLGAPNQPLRTMIEKL